MVRMRSWTARMLTNRATAAYSQPRMVTVNCTASQNLSAIVGILTGASCREEIGNVMSF